MDTETKLLLYKSFVTAHFNYCPAVWHACGAVNTAKLEKLQHRALKFVYQDYTSSYESLLKRANLPTLVLSRKRLIAMEIYKAVNKLSPPYICELFSENAPQHSYNLRKRNMCHSQKRTTKYGLLSFNHIGINIWNSLPKKLRLSVDYKQFKSMVKTWAGDCSCTFCSNG